MIIKDLNTVIQNNDITAGDDAISLQASEGVSPFVMISENRVTLTESPYSDRAAVRTSAGINFQLRENVMRVDHGIGVFAEGTGSIKGNEIRRIIREDSLSTVARPIVLGASVESMTVIDTTICSELNAPEWDELPGSGIPNPGDQTQIGGPCP